MRDFLRHSQPQDPETRHLKRLGVILHRSVEDDRSTNVALQLLGKKLSGSLICCSTSVRGTLILEEYVSL